MSVKNDVLEVRCVKLKQRVSKSQSEPVFGTEVARQRRKAVAIGKAQCEATPRTKRTSFFSFECEHRCWTRLKSPWGLENGNCGRSICSALSLSPLALVGAKDKTMCCRYNGADAVVLWLRTGDHL